MSFRQWFPGYVLVLPQMLEWGRGNIVPWKYDIGHKFMVLFPRKHKASPLKQLIFCFHYFWCQAGSLTSIHRLLVSKIHNQIRKESKILSKHKSCPFSAEMWWRRGRIICFSPTHILKFFSVPLGPFTWRLTSHSSESSLFLPTNYTSTLQTHWEVERDLTMGGTVFTTVLKDNIPAPWRSWYEI